ncbi:MAG: hypothetical protein N3D82_03435 [Ignisphaera sp.]|nr:hypothetical protein [Ignisphaera sp.]MCX8168062.1 hypothetical protein [Ignisphaera sp.]MDW8085749.1 hypothetical protein [Ignisphaera sp.]
MWYQYRKSPLGTVVRETMRAVLGVYSREEAMEKMENLRDRISARLKIVDVEQSIHELLSIDPDLADMIWRDAGRDRVVLIATWDPLDR